MLERYTFFNCKNSFLLFSSPPPWLDDLIWGQNKTNPIQSSADSEVTIRPPSPTEVLCVSSRITGEMFSPRRETVCCYISLATFLAHNDDGKNNIGRNHIVSFEMGEASKNGDIPLTFRVCTCDRHTMSL